MKDIVKEKLNKKQVNNLIKELRLRKEVTQTEFAEALGITVNYLSLLENGHREPSLDLLFRICIKYKQAMTIQFSDLKGNQ